jgi:hypothetical protein
MESKALALGKQVKAEALNSNVHLRSTRFILCRARTIKSAGVQSIKYKVLCRVGSLPT